MHSVAKNLGRNIVEAEERKRLATNGHATYFWQGILQAVAYQDLWFYK